MSGATGERIKTDLACRCPVSSASAATCRRLLAACPGPIETTSAYCVCHLIGVTRPRCSSDGGSQMEVKERRTPVGLALSGGGGKGAYEIGCWRALRDLDIPVRAVSGTSVGALNAALVAQGDLARAQDLWAEITTRDVFALKPTRLPALALRLLLIAGLPYYRSSSKDRRFHEGQIYGLSFLAALTVMIPTFAIMLATGRTGWGTVLGMVSLEGLILAIIWIPAAGWFWMERHNLFILDNQPLMTTISRALDIEKVRGGEIETFVTAASPIDYFDPDDPALYPNPANPTIDYPYRARAYLPIYSKLNGLSGTEIIQLLLSSTSLPFGIFPNRPKNEAGWLDGGVADNTPIVPLHQLGCDPIVVVHLDHKLAKWQTRGKIDRIVGARVAAIERMVAIGPDSEANLRDFIDRRSKGMPPHEPLQQHACPLPRLVHIVPSRRLGGLLRGTLRFSPRRAEWLMRLGYSDARKALLKYLAPEPLKRSRRGDGARPVLHGVAAIAALAALIMSGLAMAVYLISRLGSAAHPNPVLGGVGFTMMVLGSGGLWLSLLWKSPDPDDDRAAIIAGAGGLTSLAGLLVMANEGGLTLTQIIVDLVADVIFLAGLGAALYSKLRSWRTGHPSGDSDRLETSAGQHPPHTPDPCA